MIVSYDSIIANSFFVPTESRQALPSPVIAQSPFTRRALVEGHRLVAEGSAAISPLSLLISDPCPLILAYGSPKAMACEFGDTLS